MPMHNYLDLPREDIASWCTFLIGLPPTEKNGLLKSLWEILTSFEQNLVIVDLKEFLGRKDESA